MQGLALGWSVLGKARSRVLEAELNSTSEGFAAAFCYSRTSTSFDTEIKLPFSPEHLSNLGEINSKAWNLAESSLIKWSGCEVSA